MSSQQGRLLELGEDAEVLKKVEGQPQEEVEEATEVYHGTENVL